MRARAELCGGAGPSGSVLTLRMPDEAGPSRDSNMVGGCGMCMSLQAVRAPRNVGHGLVVVRTRATCMHALQGPSLTRHSLAPDNRAYRETGSQYFVDGRVRRAPERGYTFVCASDSGVLPRHLSVSPTKPMGVPVVTQRQLEVNPERLNLTELRIRPSRRRRGTRTVRWHCGTCAPPQCR